MKHAILLTMNFERYGYQDLATILKVFKAEFCKQGFLPSGQLYLCQGDEQQALRRAQTILDEVANALQEEFGDIRRYIKDYSLVGINPITNLLQEEGTNSR